jgi:hypothetical protein
VTHKCKHVFVIGFYPSNIKRAKGFYDVVKNKVDAVGYTQMSIIGTLCKMGNALLNATETDFYIGDYSSSNIP